MADKAQMVSYKDDATTAVTFKPHESIHNDRQHVESWMEASNVLSQNLRATITHSSQKSKNGDSRRMVKLSYPVAEVVGTVGSDGYVAPAAVAFEIPAYVVMQVPSRATDTDVANALRMLVNEIDGAVGAGTANVYRDKTAAAAEFLVHGFMVE